MSRFLRRPADIPIVPRKVPTCKNVSSRSQELRAHVQCGWLVCLVCCVGWQFDEYGCWQHRSSCSPTFISDQPPRGLRTGARYVPSRYVLVALATTGTGGIRAPRWRDRVNDRSSSSSISGAVQRGRASAIYSTGAGSRYEYRYSYCLGFYRFMHGISVK